MRNQVSGLVFGEECQGEILQFRKELIAHAKQHSPPHAAHGTDLGIAGDHADYVDGQQKDRGEQQAPAVFQPDVGVDRNGR